jgi:superfamily II DNA or RNA helicase
MNKPQDMKFISNQINEIRKLNETVKKVIANLELGFELFGQDVYDSEGFKNFTEELRSVKKFLLEYNKEFWRMKVDIEKLDLNNDMIGRFRHEYEVLKDETIKLDNKICDILVKFYKENNIGNVMTERIDDYITKVTVKLKGIPDWILEEVPHEGIHVEELEYNPLDEYVYKIYLLCENHRLIDGIQKIQDYLYKCMEKMAKLYDYKEMMFNDLERELSVKKDEEEIQYKLKDINLYKWQNEAYEVWKENNYRGIFKVATGCGKTIFALSCLQRVIEEGYNVKVVIIVPNIALLNQWEEELRDTFHVDARMIGRVGDGKNELRTFTIYINCSAQKYLKNHLEHGSAVVEPIGENDSNSYYFVIADECHRYGSDNNLEMLNYFNEITQGRETKIKFFSIGLSATPEQTNPMKTRELEKILGSIIYEYDLIRAIDEKIIATPVIRDIDIDFTSEEFKDYKKSKKIFDDSKDNLKEVLDRLHKSYEEDFLVHLAYDIIQNKKYKKIIDYVKSKKKEFRETYKQKPHWINEFNDWYNENADDDMEIAWNARNLTVAHQAKKDIVYDMEMREKEFGDNMDVFKEHRVILFAERIKDADEKLYKRLKNEYGNESVVFYNSNDRRSIKEEVINKFKSGIANILIAVEALDEGIDVPKADMAFVFQGEQDERQQIQRLGRIIRKPKRNNNEEGKEEIKENATLINLFCPMGGENIYLARFFRRAITKYREGGYGELQDTYKRGLKALGYDMDVELKQLKNYEYLRLEE